MSSLIFYTDEAQALIVTDTLAVTDNGEPLSFVSKAGYIPANSTSKCNSRLKIRLLSEVRQKPPVVV